MRFQEFQLGMGWPYKENYKLLSIPDLSRKFLYCLLTWYYIHLHYLYPLAVERVVLTQNTTDYSLGNYWFSMKKPCSYHGITGLCGKGTCHSWNRNRKLLKTHRKYEALISALFYGNDWCRLNSDGGESGEFGEQGESSHVTLRCNTEKYTKEV